MWITSRIIAVNLSLVLVMVNGSTALAVEHGGPVRVWGDVSSIYRERVDGDGDNRITNLRNTGTISASSYIWRPWFGLIDGSLSLTLEESDATGQPAEQDEFTSGNVQFGLFPTSRFPFRAYYREDRNNIELRNFDQSIESTEYGLRQQYRSPTGGGNYLAEYENNEQDKDGQNEFVAESLLLSGSNSFASQILETDLRADTVDREVTDEQIENYSITLDHSYDARTNFTLDNLLSSSRADNDLIDSNSDVETSQLTSFMSWHPRDNRQLRITGSLRATETTLLEQELGIPVQDEFETAVVNLNQGLIYQYTDNLQFNESINLNSTEVDGTVSSISTETFGARYTSDSIGSRVGEYGWNVSSTYVRLSGDIEKEESLDNQFNHSLLNNYSLDSGYQLRTNLTQSLNYKYQSEQDNESSIDHSYSVTWSNATIGRQNLIRLFITDSRDLNSDRDYIHLVNFQYNGTNRLTRYSQFSGNASLQYSNRSFRGKRSEQSSSNGRLEYLHSRVFGSPGLSFASELQLGQRLTDSEQLILDLDENIEMTWENSLIYRIGRLETRADIDVVKLGDDYDFIFAFELKRSFGDL